MLLCKGDKMSNYFKIYLEMMKMNWKVFFQYKADFLIGIISSLLVQLSGVLFIWIAFDNIGYSNGWSFYEISYMYGFFVLSKSLNSLFFDNIWNLGNEYIKNGQFDSVLLKPVPPLLYLYGSKIQKDAMGNIFIGFIMILIALNKLNHDITIQYIIIFVVFLLAGVMIFAAINLVTASFSFLFLSSFHLTWAIFSLSEFASYPLSLYSREIKILLTFIIPYGFVSYYPVTYILGKNITILGMITPVVSIIIVVIAYMFWKRNLSRYSSTGS